MDKKWVKRGKCRNFAEYVLEQTGKGLEEVVLSESEFYQCPGISQAASVLKKAVAENRPIHVVADYDADGLGAAAQMFMILRMLKATKFKITIPKRLKDGYGINMRIVDEIPDGAFLITLDNGISAFDAITEAKRRGMTVVILDHHLRSTELPPADLIVDPEDNPVGWTYRHYCGSGLAYKLGQSLFNNNPQVMGKLSVFACISTIADSVDVTADNRNIILTGLRNLNIRNCPEGLAALLDILKNENSMEHIGCEEIGYKIAPAINAPGRLYDEGGKLLLSSIFQTGERAYEAARWLYETNEKRKAAVKVAGSAVEPLGEKIRFVYLPGFEEGLCGILAGNICEDSRRPTFVMTDAADGSIKGSARSVEGTNVFELLTKAAPFLLKFGGHEFAAGFSFARENLDNVFLTLEQNANAASDTQQEFFDLEINQEEIFQVYLETDDVSVFGTGLPKPVFRIRADIEEAKLVGSDMSHLSFKINGQKCIGFSLAEKYIALGSPMKMIVYGTLSTNWWKGRASIQIDVIDIEL